MSGGDLINAAINTEELEVSAAVTTEEPEVAATLSDLRYLVFQGMKGDTGDSAYEEAVSLGFVGTEAEWIASLKGEKGDTGFSPEIRVTDITGGHKVDVYNELGFESFDVMDGIDGEDGEDGTDGVSPTVTVADIAGGHRVTITDATHPQGQSFAVMNGSGIPEDVKVALLNCFENVAWINDDGQAYYDALYAALYPPKTLVSISAVFTQGSAVIYDTDSLDTLKQYLTVTAIYDDTSTGVVTNYTLSGTLTEGTSTITVLCNGKTTTFTVAVTHRLLPLEYQQVEYIESSNTGNGPYFRFRFALPNEFVLRTKTFQASHITSSADPFIGAELSDQTYYSRAELGYAGSTENRLYLWSGDSARVDMQNGAYGKPLVFEAMLSSTAPNKVLTVSSDQETLTNSITSANRGNFTHVIIFGHVYNPFAGRIYYFSIETLNGEVIMNLIPCYRISDGVIGMYDLVSNTFHTNDAASGTFTKGGDVQ